MLVLTMSEWTRRQVERAARGESAAISWFYQRFAPPLLRRLGARFAYLRAIDPEDLLHDTFIYLLGHEGRALHRFISQTPLSALTDHAIEQFLWSAACGVTSNRLRTQRRYTADLLLPDRPAQAIRSSEGSTLARDALARLAACLAERGEDHYLYFQFRYLHGLTPAEIVTATGWSRKKTYKLKQTLDEALENCLERLGLA